jgi:hypothetical protein
MEFFYNVIVPVTLLADSREQAEAKIIDNLAEFVLENAEKVTLKWIGQRSNLA